MYARWLIAPVIVVMVLALATGSAGAHGSPTPSAAPAAEAAKSTVGAVCRRAYPHQFSRTYKISRGKKTVYNRDLSRALVCDGGFGAPDAYRPTIAAACDLIFAAYNVHDARESLARKFGCAPAEVHDEGWIRGASETVKSVVCAYVVEVIGEGVGVFAAGVTFDPALGVAVWKGVTFFGDTLVCIGISKLTKSARSWGISLEGRHETHVARDIETRGKCLQMTDKRITGIHWSAVDCPAGFKGSKLPSGEATQPVDNPGGTPSTTDPTPSDTGDGGDDGSTAPAGADVPTGTHAETAGGVTHTWTDPSSAGGSQGASVQTGQTIGISCKLQGFRVANGNPWWYRIASSPWNDAYYASADAFYNNGQTSGPLQGTPYVDPSVPDCASGAPPTSDTPPGSRVETVGGVTHTWSNYANAGGTQGPSIQTGQSVAIACKVQGFKVADGNTWWYRIASSPWNGSYYASADAFYNNGQTTGSLVGTPWVDGSVPDCFSPPPTTYAETVGGVTHTWTNYTNAGGTQGPSIQTGQTVQIACKLQGFRVADGNTWWYRIASSPWNSSYYASADAFYNNGQTSGSLSGTPFVDNAVPNC